MGARDLIDFDAAFDDADDEPLTIRLLGREWQLPAPSQVPAALLLKLDRLMLQVAQAEQSGQVPDDMVVDPDLSLESVARNVIGDTLVDEWLEAGLPYPRLQRVIARVLAIYRNQDVGPGEAEAANRAQRRAAAKPKARKATAKGSPSTKSSARGR